MNVNRTNGRRTRALCLGLALLATSVAVTHSLGTTLNDARGSDIDHS